MNSREEHIPVQRTARYRVLGSHAAEELWIVLHGYGQLAERFVRRFHGLPGIDEGRRRIVAPEALSRFYVERQIGQHGPTSTVGATWMTREDREHEIRDYVAYLDAVLSRVAPADRGRAESTADRKVPGEQGLGTVAGGDSSRHVLLGFSQGAETASRWAVLGARPPATLVLWGGGLAEDLATSRTVDALRESRVVFVVGDRDRWAQQRSAAGLELLRGAGLEPERIGYPGGHRVDPGVLAAHWP